MFWTLLVISRSRWHSNLDWTRRCVHLFPPSPKVQNDPYSLGGQRAGGAREVDLVGSSQWVQTPRWKDSSSQGVRTDLHWRLQDV